MGRETDVSLPAGRQAEAMARLAVLRRHLEDGVSITCAVKAARVPIRTAPAVKRGQITLPKPRQIPMPVTVSGGAGQGDKNGRFCRIGFVRGFVS